MGLSKIGPPKTCERIIKLNLKDYRGLVNAENSDLNSRFKKLLSYHNAPTSTVQYPNLTTK